MIGTWGMKYFKKLPLSITENTLELLTENSTCYGSRVKCVLSLKSLIKNPLMLYVGILRSYS